MIQQFHYWTYIQGKLYFKKIHALQCSLEHYLQQPRHGSDLNVHWQGMDKDAVVYRLHIQCMCTVVHVQWNIT